MTKREKIKLLKLENERLRESVDREANRYEDTVRKLELAEKDSLLEADKRESMKNRLDAEIDDLKQQLALRDARHQALIERAQRLENTKRELRRMQRVVDAFVAMATKECQC